MLNTKDNLILLSPQKTLDRGYSILQDKNENIIFDPNLLKTTDKYKITLAKGTAEFNIQQVIR